MLPATVAKTMSTSVAHQNEPRVLPMDFTSIVRAVDTIRKRKTISSTEITNKQLEYLVFANLTASDAPKKELRSQKKKAPSHTVIIPAGKFNYHSCFQGMPYDWQIMRPPDAPIRSFHATC